MFAIHDVFKPTKPLGKINGPVRVVDTVGLEKVILIDVDDQSYSVPFSIDYQKWLEHLGSNALEKITDPYLKLSSMPKGLPQGAAARFKQVLAATSTLSQQPSLLHTPKTLAKEIAAVAKSTGLNARTIKRWVCDWLKTGRNPAAVVRKFSEANARKPANTQTKGKKRGVGKTILGSASDAPAHEVAANIRKAYDLYMVENKMNWRDAYHEMLVKQYRIPEDAMSEDEKGLFLDRILIEKFRVPTWDQFRYRCRQLKKTSLGEEPELPRGERGKASDDSPGPGFFEIDATHFQIQLVSRLSKGELVGRPTVYLIVDIYSGTIVGYAVTLENPSWATAALALYNCFSDKGPIFKYLGLPFDSKDWPCQHLPNMLRADRAELVSNMGQEFPSSGIRVEISPSMTPIAKGTVEGKHAEVKKPQKGRFDLPGRFAKIRKRRDSDGKKAAALDIFEFERILVEIIMDINWEPVEPRRIPPDALPFGAKVASRIGLYQWALTHRAGFTRSMGPNFVYEHLLTKAEGTVTPQGIHAKGEIFNCDRLRELGFLAATIDKEVKITVSYNPLLASEIYFFDRERGIWAPAYNVDLEISRLKASFPEAKEYRAIQNLLVAQADFNNHGRRRKRIPVIRQAIRKAVREKAETNAKTSGSNARIRENRAQERANQRSAGLNGALPTVPSPSKPADSQKRSATTPSPSTSNANPTAGQQIESGTAKKAKSLWSKVNAVNKQ